MGLDKSLCPYTGAVTPSSLVFATPILSFDKDTVEDKAVFVTTKVPSISGVDVDAGRLN